MAKSRYYHSPASAILHPHPGPVLDGLGNMVGQNHLAFGQVGLLFLLASGRGDRHGQKGEAVAWRP